MASISSSQVANASADMLVVEADSSLKCRSLMMTSNAFSHAVLRGRRDETVPRCGGYRGHGSTRNGVWPHAGRAQRGSRAPVRPPRMARHQQVVALDLVERVLGSLAVKIAKLVHCTSLHVDLRPCQLDRAAQPRVAIDDT